MMRSSRCNKGIKSSAVYGHTLILVGLLLHQTLEGKLGEAEPVLHTNDLIGGKRGAKKGRGGIVPALKARKEFCSASVLWHLPRHVMPDATMRVVLQCSCVSTSYSH